MSQRERDLLKIMGPVLQGQRSQSEAARRDGANLNLKPADILDAVKLRTLLLRRDLRQHQFLARNTRLGDNAPMFDCSSGFAEMRR